MILNYPLTKADSGGVIPPIPPIDPQAVPGASFLRKGDDTDLTITDSVNPTPLVIKSFLLSCFYRAAPSAAARAPIEFLLSGDIRVKVTMAFSVQPNPAADRDHPFRIEFTFSNGDVLYIPLSETDTQPYFLRQNSWHHIFLIGRLVAGDTEISIDSFINMGMTRSTDPIAPFNDTDSSFTPVNTSVGFTFKTNTEARFAAFEPSLAHCYCEVSDSDSISASPVDFINMVDGTPKEITTSFGGTPIMYAFVDENDSLLNVVSGNSFSLSTTDWEADPIAPIVTCAYQAFQNSLVSLKQSEDYTGVVSLKIASINIPEGESFVNFWVGDFFTNKGSGTRINIGGTGGSALVVEFTGTIIRFYHYIQATDTVVYDTEPVQPKGWLNISINWTESYTVHPTELFVKINDLAPETIQNPSSTSGGETSFSLLVSTPTQSYGPIYFYDSAKVAANSQIDWGNLTEMHDRFVSTLGEPIWNGMDGAAAVGARPTIFVNPALGNGHLCRIITDINDNLIYSSVALGDQPNAYISRCTYFVAMNTSSSTSSIKRVEEPFQLFEEITYKV